MRDLDLSLLHRHVGQLLARWPAPGQAPALLTAFGEASGATDPPFVL